VVVEVDRVVALDQVNQVLVVDQVVEHLTIDQVHVTLQVMLEVL
jgi:hypothetical protein